MSLSSALPSRMRPALSCAASLALLSLLPGFASAQGPGVLNLGDLPGRGFASNALGVSAGGSVVVGTGASENGTEAYRWTASTGMVGLGDLAGDEFNSIGQGVSADGGTVVGYGRSANGQEAFRWTAAGGMVGLGDLPGSRFESEATAVSADGSVVVGRGIELNEATGGPATRAVRWTSAGGIASLGLLSGDVGSIAYGVSGDGSVVVGWSGNAEGRQAFRWESGAMTGLGDLPGGAFRSEALAVSADGKVVVGYGTTAQGEEAFRWTAAGGMVSIGVVPGGSDARPFAASADGSVIVGYGSIDFETVSFVWTAEEGMRLLRDVLQEQGIDLNEQSLTYTRDVSADGTVIVGMGNGPGGFQAWRADLAPVHRWINPNGGDYDVASNWSPARVPGPTATVLFDLAGTYTVTGGAAGKNTAARTAERLVAENGATVDFEDVGFALTSPTQERPSLSVIGGSTAKLVRGSAQMNFASVGTVANPAGSTAISRLQVFNEGTFLDGDASLLVGQEGRGEVFVANKGRLRTFSARLGINAYGEVIVGNGGKFEVTDELELGRGASGKLTVENGGAVTSRRVNAGVFESPDSSVVNVSGLQAGTAVPSSLVVEETIALGHRDDALLRVRGGAEVRANVLSLRGTDLGSGHVQVSGHAGSSSSVIVRSFQVGVTASSSGPGAAHSFATVFDGGLVRTEGLTAGGVGGNVGVLWIRGIHGPSGVPSRVDASVDCVMGIQDGEAAVVVSEGAVLRCKSAMLAFGVGSEAEVFVDSASIFVVRDLLTIGSGGDANLKLKGTLDACDLESGAIHLTEPFDVVVSPTGRMTGNDGVVMGRVLNRGFVSDSLFADVSIVGKTGATMQRAAEGRRGLTIEGTYTQEEGGVLELTLAGPDTSQQGRLIVRPLAGAPSADGSATLGGTLRLVFQDGYAPRQGDAFALVEAATTTGTFQNVEVAGLAPGFQFEVETDDAGEIVLTALTDGIAVSSEEEEALPVVPSEIVLHPSTPNPIDGEAEIAFTLPGAAEVRLAVYDVLGREVAVPARGHYAAGTHRAVFRAEHLPSGVYVYRLEAGGFVQTRSMLVVR